MSDVNANGPGTGRILSDGLWWNTPGLASLVGFLPLLAASRSVATGLALGIAALVVLCASNVLIAALAGSIPARLRMTSFMVLIAALVTAVDLLFEAHWFELYGQVGLFVPLIVTNCMIVARAESFATHQGWRNALRDGLVHGTGFTLLLGGVGALRELLAPVLLVAALPSGALFLLAALLALRQAWLHRRNGE